MTDDQLETETRSGSAPIGGDQDMSEHLDDDKLGGDFPPDEPVGVEEYGITNHEQRFPEPIAERVEREIPDDLVAATGDGTGTLVAPDQGVGVDDERSLIAREVSGAGMEDLPVGDVGSDDVTRYGTVLDRSGDVAAEEAAVHIVDEP